MQLAEIMRERAISVTEVDTAARAAQLMGRHYVALLATWEENQVATPEAKDGLKCHGGRKLGQY